MNGQKKTMLILGMHRSGTSLITNWLYNCGLQVGTELMGPGPGNTEGHFEDIDFYKLHMEILKDNNLDDSGIIDYTRVNISSAYKEEIKSLIESKNKQFDQWGWKEPRTCLFLDFYREILPDAYYLVIFRDYQFVVTSLLRRAFIEIDTLYETKKGFWSKLFWQKIKRKKVFKELCHQYAASFLKAWICYNDTLIKNIQMLPTYKYLVINYEMLKKDDQGIFSFLKTNWQFALNYFRFSDVYKENLLSKTFDLDSYIEDKQLISRANYITNNLMKYALAGIAC